MNETYNPTAAELVEDVRTLLRSPAGHVAVNFPEMAKEMLAEIRAAVERLSPAPSVTLAATDWTATAAETPPRNAGEAFVSSAAAFFKTEAAEIGTAKENLRALVLLAKDARAAYPNVPGIYPSKFIVQK